MTTAQWLAASALALCAGVPAHADQLTVLSAAAVKTSVAPVPALFSAQSEDRVQFQFGTAGAMRDRATQGERFDLIIVPPAAMAELVARNLVDAASQQPLGTVRLGAGVASGHAALDLRDLDALKRALVAAQSVGIADPAKGATTGIYLAKLFAQLGLSDDLKTKLQVYPDGQNAMEAAASHAVDIAIGQFSEASTVAGLEPLSALPEAAQLKTTYVAAIAQQAPHAALARRLLDLLVSKPVQRSFHANGFDTGAAP